ncbi:MAG: DUF692 domain-containing protein [Xanthomonadales bacterium]|nr:DUF692 domain-containing protein [Xanthomonadales bacterium]
MTLRLPATAVGIGLRRPHLAELAALPDPPVDFFELAPENWIGVGGAPGRLLAALLERRPVALHGLSLSLAGPDPLDRELLARSREFADRHRAALHSDHLAATSVEGQLYELLPVPFAEATVRHAAARIAAAQDCLGRRIAVENISYYLGLGGELSELEFLRAVLEEADCELLLDLNNVHVNAANHGYDPYAFIAGLPAERIAGYHLAGHFREGAGLLIDTHGAPVPEPVWTLFAWTVARVGPRPTVIERDFNLPPPATLFAEAARARSILLEAEAAPSAESAGA